MSLTTLNSFETFLAASNRARALAHRYRVIIEVVEIAGGWQVRGPAYVANWLDGGGDNYDEEDSGIEVDPNVEVARVDALVRSVDEQHRTVYTFGSGPSPAPEDE